MLISNVSLISNYARDFKASQSLAMHQHGFQPDIPGASFIVNQDIVVPQETSYDLFLESQSADFIAWRPHDSSFEGSFWGGSERAVIQAFEETAKEDYLEKGFEQYSGAVSKPRPYPMGLRLRRSYFAWQPCGMGWCWSRRLYETIAARTIPILIGSDIILPFEKFLNWESFTVKISSDTWHSIHSSDLDSNLSVFRRALRQEADKFRWCLFDFYESMGVNIDLYNQTTGDGAGVELRITSELVRRAKESDEAIVKSAYINLKDTLIWRKMRVLHEVFPWLYFNNTEDSYQVPWKHPFKLLQLEMWCQVTTLEYRITIHRHSEHEDLCLRPANRVASLEYL